MASLTSYETALCVIPPSQLTGDIDRLRSLYDKGHGRWPPHLNLIYPFVAPELLHQTSDILKATLSNRTETSPIRLRLDEPGFFARPKQRTTIFVTDSGGDGAQALIQLTQHLIRALGEQTRDPGRLHLTIGQCEAGDLQQRQYLFDKVSLLPNIEWEVMELAILIRDRSQGGETASCLMRVWGTISLVGEWASCPLGDTASNNFGSLDCQDHIRSPPFSLSSETGTTFCFSPEKEENKWIALPATSSHHTNGEQIQLPVSIASYNVLIDSPHPPPTERYPILLRNILSSAARADILILQEVADDFLSFLLKDDEIRAQYSFATHGPPDQAEVGPLSSLRNIVILSRWAFSWQWLPFERRHKGAVVLQLEKQGTFHNSTFYPLVVAGVHLTCGLVDGSIRAKRSQLQTIIRHLSTNFPHNHWVVAGDFNITTSSYTIDMALNRKSITPQGASILASLDGMLTEACLVDCYFAARAHAGPDGILGSASGDTQSEADASALYEGEEGATFDPTKNHLAAHITGQSYHSRPQRYDRILVRGDRVRILSFNMFGFDGSDVNGEIGSDHWGVRTSLMLNDFHSANVMDAKIPIDIGSMPTGLGGIEGLKECLKTYQTFPSEEEISHRMGVLDLIKRIVNQRDTNLSDATRLNLSFVTVPVGSYGLGVWSTSSDMDILVIGQVSPRTFFALIVAKLRQATDKEVIILRKVKATSGMMLELEARGIRVDLQYCPATRVVESWPQMLSLPPNDATFDLPIQSLLKLNALRDMNYLQHTIPDLGAFRLAYRFIKLWAQRRGIYSSKLGYLGGIHITLLLTRICKLLFNQYSITSPVDIISAFFRHYAKVDWTSEVIYDPGFFTNPPRYFRSQREPLVILTQNSPKVNVARAASNPSTRTLELELKRANQLLSKPDVTWVDIVNSTDSGASGADEFLTAHQSYVKVNMQYWGGGASRGKMLVGWLEWRCVGLLVEIHRRFPDIHARIWPARFTDMERQETNEPTAEYRGCYLIGLSKANVSRIASMTDADKESARIALLAILNAFAEEIRQDENYFDASCCWVDIHLVQASALKSLRLDSSNWGNLAHDENDLSDDGDDDEIDLDEEDEEIEEADNRASRSRRKHSLATHQAVGIKLRPASDILSRLRWDPDMDIEDYLIGYDDRFLGAKEMPVSRWKVELTDEEFIPMHRILYFKRRSDGVRVWDRETRTDMVFGSGSSAKAQP